MKPLGRKTVAILAVLLAVGGSGLSPVLSRAEDPGIGPGTVNGFDGGPGNQGGPGRAPGGRRGATRDSDPIVRLGRAVFFDPNLSNPAGMSCASCHAPEAGFSYPNSHINQAYGTVPGVVSNRFGSRKPMTISYSWFTPDGPTFWNRRERAWTGGFFSDGRAGNLTAQAGMPIINPSEMANTVHGLPATDLVVHKVIQGSYADLFKQAYGENTSSQSPQSLFRLIRQSISAYEKSHEVSPFSSKYDAYVEGQAQLTPSELNGLRLFTGSTTGRPGGAKNYKSAQCVSCHAISDDGRRDFFTNWTFANVGVPRNPHNPFYRQTNPAINPQGYNRDGEKFVDLGLGAILYPLQNLPPGNLGSCSDGRGDFLQANGEFRVPSLRNVDKRPSADFVKCYMHNGVFKSLKEVVHFYNTRNLTRRNEVINLASADPYTGLKGKPLWPLPEYPSAVTLQNPAGKSNSPTARVGNLGLSDQEESDIVAFLQTLSDGYYTPIRRPPPPN
jgi:cytochrome c peroxidase